MYYHHQAFTHHVDVTKLRKLKLKLSDQEVLCVFTIFCGYVIVTTRYFSYVSKK